MRRGCLAAAVIAAAICMQGGTAAAAARGAGADARGAAAAAARGAAADAPAMSVRVQNDPLRIEFVDARDGDVLAAKGFAYTLDLREPVVNNAYLGYYAAAEVQTVTFHATRVESQAGTKIVAATDDPLGNKLEIEWKELADGVVAIESHVPGDIGSRATLSAVEFEPAGTERYMGFGSRSNAVDQTGNRVFSWAEEGPFSAGNGEELTKNIPDFTFPTGPTATNLPIPWLISTRGFGVLIDRPERSYFDLLSANPARWTAEVEANAIRLVVFGGPKPAETLRRYSAFSGRQPKPAPWLFGPWFQPTGEKRPLELARRFRDQDVPVTLAQTYTHYLPCGAQKGKEKDERERVAAYHALGFRITTYFNPHVCTTYQPVYDEMAAKGYFVKNQAGEPYVLSNPFTADEQVSEVDFTNPGAKRYFQKLLGEAVDVGYDGWMEDFGEYTPTDSVFANGQTGRTMHNPYTVLYHAASTEATAAKAPAVFVRSGFQGIQRYARAVWGGDPTEDWSCTDGLCAALHQLLNVGLSGIAYQGSDIGGFHAIVNSRTSDELNIRWLQLGALSGIMRTQANGFAFRDNRAQRSQVWSSGVMPRWRRWAKFRTQMWPYIQAASDEYQRTGMPIARQLALVFPDDPQAAASQTEFMFGPDLLAAPVITEGARRRKLYLPKGRWIEFWRGVRWDRKTGAMRMVRAGALDGGRELTVRAPIYELPLFVRAGAVITLLPPDVDTLAAIPKAAGSAAPRGAAPARGSAAPRGAAPARGSAAGIVDARDRPNRVVLAFPRATRRGARFRLGDGTPRTYAVQASIQRRPCRMTVNGKRVAFRWFRKRRVLHSTFRTRGGRIVITSCRSKA